MKYEIDDIKAAEYTGFPLEFINSCHEFSKLLDTAIAIRIGQPPNVKEGYTVSPKPISIKAHTYSGDNHLPLLAGFIPADKTFLDQEVPSTEKIKTQQLHISLNEILLGTAKGEYSNTKLIDNKLYFDAPLNKICHDANIKFSIDLTKKINSSSNYINQNLRNFDGRKILLNSLHPLSYHQNHITKPLNVLASENGNPITGDADLLWIAQPKKLRECEYGNELNKLYNCNIKKEREQLLKIIYKLLYQAKTNITEKLLNEINLFAETAGILSPYEFIIATYINQSYEKNPGSIKNLIQHGPETHNPGNLSRLSKTLHFYDNKVAITENEEDLIELATEKDNAYLKHYHLEPHPLWNKDKWKPVNDANLQVNNSPQKLDSKTTQSYQHALFFKPGKPSLEKTMPPITVTATGAGKGFR